MGIFWRDFFGGIFLQGFFCGDYLAGFLGDFFFFQEKPKIKNLKRNLKKQRHEKITKNEGKQAGKKSLNFFFQIRKFTDPPQIK